MKYLLPLLLLWLPLPLCAEGSAATEAPASTLTSAVQPNSQSINQASQAVNRAGAQPGLEGGDYWQVFGALVLVLALFLAMAWVMKRIQTGSLGKQANRINLLSGMALTTRERVVLLEVDGCKMLVGVAPGRVTPIHVFDQPSSQSPAQDPAFAAALQAALEQSAASGATPAGERPS